MKENQLLAIKGLGTLTPFEGCAIRRIPEHENPIYLVEIVRTQPEGEWITPSNGKNDLFTIFDKMSRYGLVERKIIPIWKNGGFKGNIHKFRYLENLNY